MHDLASSHASKIDKSKSWRMSKLQTLLETWPWKKTLQREQLVPTHPRQVSPGRKPTAGARTSRLQNVSRRPLSR